MNLLTQLYKDMVGWNCRWMLEKFRGDDAIQRELFLPGAEPFDVVTFDGNLLVYGGGSLMWECLIGNGTATPAQALTTMANARAALGVGDSSTAAAATQTNLVAATNKLRKAMDATYPVHTDGTGVIGNCSIDFKSTFATGDANYAWEEVGTFNDVTANANRMLNRKVQSLGTKTSAGTWVLTETITLA